MAEKKAQGVYRNENTRNKRTSIGDSRNSRPNHKQANKKKYRGQGK